MKSRTIVIVVGLAVVGQLAAVGAGVALGLFAAFGLVRTFDAAAQQKMVTVFVAAAEIRQGTVITDPEKLFVVKQLPVEEVPPNAITDLRQLQDMQALRTLDAGAICTQQSIGKFEPRSGSPAGLRAFSVRVHLTQPVPVPGSRVDVLAISDKGGPSGKITKVVLRNILVLATEGWEPNPKLDKDGTTLVTLAVTPAEAERLVSAEADRIVLRIRPSEPGDDKKPSK